MCSSVDPPPWVNIDFPTDETFPSPLIVGKKVKVVGKFPTGKNLVVCTDEWEIRRVNLLQRVTHT